MKWYPREISKTCEVIVHESPMRHCGNPTTHAYPAQPVGYMALCWVHASKHPYASKIEDLTHEKKRGGVKSD